MAISLIYRISRRRISALTALTLLIGFTSIPGFAGAPKRPALDPRYQHWLSDEVNYLITNDEVAGFKSLPDDAARERFMQSFWLIRNPHPADPDVNEARDEHYRRLAFVNAHFGSHAGGEGVHTDRGMAYITLGPPQQREVHPEAPHLRPIEIWFYENGTAGLPAHFYLLFYRQSFSEDFKLYSPYSDRPERLVSGSEAVNNDARAMHYLNNALTNEAARVAVSLIPGEPVDTNNPEPTMQSDVLLGHIRDYRNLPDNKELLSLRRSALEGVSHRIILGQEFSDLTTVVTRDGQDASLHYLLSLRNPEDLAFTDQPNGNAKYDLQMEAELVSDGKLVYRDTELIGGEISKQQAEALRRKCFAAEGRLPVAPGKFELRLILTNRTTHQSFRQTRTVLVPDAGQRLGVSPVFFADNNAPMADNAHVLPFSVSGAKLSPRGGDSADLPSGAPLRAVFQLWEAPSAPDTIKGHDLEIHYLIGQPGSQSDAKIEEDQTVDRGSFDASGNLVIGRDFRTDSLVPGTYRFVLRVTDPETKATTFQSINFRVASSGNPPPLRWTAIVPSYTRAGAPARNMLRRGLCALAGEHGALAADYLSKADKLQPNDPEILKAQLLAFRMNKDVASAAAAERRLAALPQSSPLN